MSERDLACTQGHPADLRTDGVNKVNESGERAEVSRLVQSTKGESLRALSKYKTDLYGSPSACQQLKLGVVHGVRVAQSLAFYGSDPLHLLQVPMLYSQYRTCLLHLFNELPGSVDYMK